MVRIFLTLIFSFFSLAGFAAEGSWSYKFNKVDDYKKHLRYSASVNVGYMWYTVYPRKDNNTLAVRFGYWEKELTELSQFKVILGAADGKTLTFSGELNSDNLSSGMFGDSPTITIYINKKHLDFHRKATSLKVVLSGKVLNFTMKNSRTAINQAQNAANNPATAAIGLDGLVEACNNHASHPWDNNRTKTGVEWKDIKTKSTIETCLAAYDLDKSNMRIAYQLGRAFDKDGNIRTLEFLKYAADNGYSPAAYHYSLLMDDGVYVPKNKSAYLQYLSASAQSGFTPAQATYGEHLIKQPLASPEVIQHGRGFLETAVEKGGYNPARYFLAMKWLDGTFGEKNNKRAVDYLTNASYMGHAKSSYFIATMYRDGNRLAQDPEKYLKYLKKAASQGHKKAKEMLAE